MRIPALLLCLPLLGIARGADPTNGWTLSVPQHPDRPQTELEWQYTALLNDLRDRDRICALSNETFHAAALIDPSDRDPADIVARRTTALLEDLQRVSSPTKFVEFRSRLERLQSKSTAIAVDQIELRFQLYEQLCALRREIALSNPLLDFNGIVFIKRHRALYNHMCDQYYGMAARPGGGLFVLSNAFGAQPVVRDVLIGATVEDGRLAGQHLSGGPNTPYTLFFDGEGNLRGDDTEGGSFLAPEVSPDGKKILFAYVECAGDRRHRSHTDPTRGHWPEGRAYHIFEVDIAGSTIRQLTDGSWNDFSPCYLPNGRIAFISERRGGYLRCGRTCPTYTLFDMAADGSNIDCLSIHETNEWDPSVAHDGRIVWTRWDYVDRHGCTAHMPWLTSLEGRDPRPIHGNYSLRKSRPDMELNVRAIPNSTKYVATAAPHHGQCFGSLVVIDPEADDDDAMGPIKRLTPEVGFPETQGGAEAFGTAWPLGENYFLCAYDAQMPPGNHVGKHETQYPNNYGIYLIDAFGNKELLYRDSEISSISPIPLRPRALPPAAAPLVHSPRFNPSEPTLAAPAAQEEATVSILNVYESRAPWPQDTTIKSLRVLQLLPMTAPSGSPPHETGVRVKGAEDSVVPVRYVLGTVPVEEDGSAHFIVPANRELFFQALDERGRAVQSMRSATALRAGEHLTCQGCHAPANRTPSLASVPPVAFRKSPARITPEVDGSNPFSFPRLVQPVLDKNCVECHAKNSERSPNLGREPLKNNWFASYDYLARKWGFWNYNHDYRTLPGQFGANAAKLLPFLEKGHYDVNLSQDDLHRLTLWLDCSSMFYGVYEKAGGIAQLSGAVARPTLE